MNRFFFYFTIFMFCFLFAGNYELKADNNLQWSNESPKTMPWVTAMNYCADLNKGGHNDWRLPNINELKTLIQSGKYSKTQYHSWVWSSSIRSDDSSYAWIIHFHDGQVAYKAKTNYAYVRCVRGSSHSDSKKTATKSADSKNKKETAKTEKLQWSQKAPRKINWNNAVNYCKSLNEDGHYDWRLPNIDELRTLIKNCPTTQTGGKCRVKNICDIGCWNDACRSCDGNNWSDSSVEYSKLGDRDWFWSSSGTSGTSDDYTAWSVNFSTGYVGYDQKSEDFYVRCVRNSSHSDLKKTATKSTDSKNKKETAKTDKLQWSEKVSSAITWEDAAKYCKNRNEGGHNDWRLPTISELRTLIQNCPATQTGGECKVTDSCLSPENCWSLSCSCDLRENNGGYYSKLGDNDKVVLWSTSLLSDNYNRAWFVMFKYGSIYYFDGKNKHHVRCVREAQPSDFNETSTKSAEWTEDEETHVDEIEEEKKVKLQKK